MVHASAFADMMKHCLWDAILQAQNRKAYTKTCNGLDCRSVGASVQQVQTLRCLVLYTHSVNANVL